MLNSRAQRREYERELKKSDPAAYRKWKAESVERGKNIHQAHIENVRIVQSDFYEAKQKAIIESLRAAGRSDEWIDAYLEKWIEGIKAI
jgi:hypothetical protein